MPSTTFSAQLRAWCTRSRPSGDRPYVSAAQPTKRAPRQNSFVCAVAAPSEVSVESTTSTNVQDDRITQDDWDRFTAAYTSQYEEHAFFADASSVEGEIPKELCGTLLRNGPALYEIGGKSIPQPFDGDGMVAVFAFPGEGKPPYFANRFVRTKGK